ncbi:glycoside hydrolase family 30 beta sandwich domain-containing protein [Rossellomorea sp. KS-H15a]|uniref:glycoside hydrolase family 30 protein n=1 Tax=Rossellomorea sp. KS-H15a TaxID=2963940 RepID=UPI0020C601D1|nr:glycoside hydrolase family 30 protein [Rossellomorea sp. KS-H15a]UTE78179.1 glucosylceramidase [Rossellomorea sp. KS-H15a]
MNMKVILTAKETGDRFSEKEPVSFSEGRASTHIQLDRELKYQEILGFGGAFTEAAAHSLSLISPEKRKEIIHRYFDPSEGLGYRFGRTHINSCDFSLGNYAYVEDGDTSLESFSIEREKKLVIPLIREAKEVAGGELSIVASPWSPPSWMKTNGEMNNGGKLLPEFQSVWADYYSKYIEAMEEEGIGIWGLTIQNEPEAKQVWDSCLYTGEEERYFIKDHLGPSLEKHGHGDVKVIIWDHNRDVIHERAKAVLSDPEAAKYVWGTGVHWYVSEEFDNLSKVHHDFPDKHLIFTEGCIEGGVRPGAWDTGERYGRNIMGDLNNYLEAWIDWNIVLNEEGGPNHVGNYCDAPVIVDTVNDEVRYNSSYYYIGHFSKYIKVGARRIGCQISNDAVSAASFENPDGEIVVIVMNANDREEQISLAIGEGSFNTTLPLHSIATFMIR